MELIKNGTAFTVKGFKWDASYNYAKYNRETDETGSRLYQVGEYNVPSVTTILSKTQSEDKRKKLDEWRERVGYTEAARITQKAALRGTEMHYVLENYINGIGYLNLSEKGAEARLMAHEVVKGLPELTKVFGSEVSLAYENKWAGSTDLVCEFKGKPTILDFKQSNKPKREEWIEDYYYQIAAYSLAHKKQYGDIKQGVIAMCTPNLVFQRFIMDESTLAEYEEKWFEKIEKFYRHIQP
jgi:genome maintenance exonuclease 1|tara:strand:+ start:841 stop:1560 length:720 start_codon:yes stop_codon:yes gene_type:complete